MKHKQLLLRSLLPLLIVSFVFFVGLAQSQDKIEPTKMEKTTETKIATASGPQPEIKFDREDLTYDIGNIQQMGKGEITIKFKNIGNAELKIHKVKAG